MAARKNTSRKKKQKTNEKEAGQPKFFVKMRLSFYQLWLPVFYY